VSECVVALELMQGNPDWAWLEEETIKLKKEAEKFD
jgi:hypothetical protein